MALTFLKLIGGIICFSVFIETFVRYFLMCEYKPVVLFLIIILLAVIILLLYLSSEKTCLCEIDQVK